jgi:hypothetical protein
MRITAALAFVLVTAFAAPAFGQSFVGEWTATAKSPAGEASEIVTVAKTKDGYAITAKLVGAQPGTPEAGPGADIVIDGDRFSYKRTVTIGNDSLVITYTGVVSGDTFTGMASLGDLGSVPYVGVRNKH